MIRSVEEIKNDLITLVNGTEAVSYEESDNLFKIKVSSKIVKSDLIDFLMKLYTFETELTDNKANCVYLDLKGLDIESLAEAIRCSLTREDLVDPIMILNIINLIKIYNTLSEEFFASDNIYVSSIEELLDLRLEISEELKEFSKKLSIYFISLFKSYNKVVFTALDEHIALPNIYKAIFLSTDLLTLSGIFSDSEPFSTDECVIIDNAFEYLMALQEKNNLCLGLMDSFFKRFNNDNSN